MEPLLDLTSQEASVNPGDPNLSTDVRATPPSPKSPTADLRVLSIGSNSNPTTGGAPAARNKRKSTSPQPLATDSSERLLKKIKLANGIPDIPENPDQSPASGDSFNEEYMGECLAQLTQQVAGIKKELAELPQRMVSALQSSIKREIEAQFQNLQNRVTNQLLASLKLPQLPGKLPSTPALNQVSNSQNPSQNSQLLTPTQVAQIANPQASKPNHVPKQPLSASSVQKTTSVLQDTQPNCLPVATPTSSQFIQAPVQIRIEDLHSDCNVHRVKILDIGPPVDIFDLDDDTIYRVFLKYKYPSIFVQALFVLQYGSYRAMHLNTSSRVKNNLELIPENFVTRLTLLVVRWFPNCEDLDFGKCLNQKQRSILSAARSCLFFKKCDACKKRNIESLPSTYSVKTNLLVANQVSREMKASVKKEPKDYHQLNPGHNLMSYNSDDSESSTVNELCGVADMVSASVANFGIQDGFM